MTVRTTTAVVLLFAAVATSIRAGGEWTVPASEDAFVAVRWVATRSVHGWVDDHLSMPDLSAKATHEPLYITCGTAALWAVDRLAKAGYEARVVMAMNWGEWDGWNDGHTFIEVRTADGWVAFDTDRKVRWTHDGKPLSMLEWLRADYEIVPILAQAFDEADYRAQDARWSEVPFIGADGLYWFPSGPWDADLLAYSPDYRVLPESEWMARFYG